MLHFLLALAFFVGQARDLLLEHPGLELDLSAERLALSVASQPPGENAWPHLEQALTAFATISREVHARLESEPDLYLEFNVLFEDLDEWIRPEQLPRFREVATETMASLEAAGIFEALARAAEAPRCIHDEALLSSGRGGHMRGTARMAAARMQRAADQGDWDTCVESARAMFVTARAAAQEGNIIGRLIGNAIMALAVGHITDILVVHEPPGEVLFALQEELERQYALFPPVPTTLAIDRLMTLEHLSTMYTDAGDDGLLILRPARDLVSMIVAMRQFLPHSAQDLQLIIGAEHDWFDRTPLVNLLGFGLASRNETFDALDPYFEGIEGLAGLARPLRTPEVFDPHQIVESLSWRHSMTRAQILMHWASHQMIFNTEDQVSLDVNGLRTVLALERYERRKGEYPDHLEQLVPAFLQEVPSDSVSGMPLVYRRIDRAADPHGRGYLLYSVGDDRRDDGGVEHPENRHRALIPGKGEGLDYVLNRRRSD